MTPQFITRRQFLARSLAGTATAATAWHLASLGGIVRAGEGVASRVAISKGSNRAENAFRAMQIFKREIASAIGDKHIIVKPNVVNHLVELADTHVDWLEGILEFLKSIGKTNVTIAESTPRCTVEGFENMGYYRLLKKYPARLADLNQEGSEVVEVWKNASSLYSIRVSRLLLNPDNFIISCPRIKTHNTVVATLSLKNVAMAAPMVDPGIFFEQPGSSKTHKTWMHGDPSDAQVLNDNIHRLAKIYGIHPDLSVIDGYQGMQGNGPSGGHAAPEQQLGIASFDWVAADRVCVQLMGHDIYQLGSHGPYPACLSYCAQSGLGEWNLNNIEILGEPIAGNVVAFEPHDGVQNGTQLGMRETPRE